MQFCCLKSAAFFIDAAKQRMDTDFCFLFTPFFFIFLQYAIDSFSECYERGDAIKAFVACKSNVKSWTQAHSVGAAGITLG